MSFFGFESSHLEADKQKFLNGALNGSEKLAEYTWGEDSYDGLGDALHEGRDELNDETFGASGPVGRDFDYASRALPDDLPQYAPASNHNAFMQQHEPAPQPRTVHPSWDDKSLFSVLGRSNSSSNVGNARTPGESSRFAPFGDQSASMPVPQPSMPIPQPSLSRGASHTSMHSLAEIEAQMHARQQQQAQAQALGARLTPQLREASPGLYDNPARLLQQRTPQVVPAQVQQRTPPPRMHPHAQSPRFHQLQQEILIQQQHHQLEEQRHLHALHERLQLEELERQARAAQAQEQLRRRERGAAAYLDEAEALRRLQRLRLEEQQRELAGSIGAFGEERAAYHNGDLKAMQQQIQRQQRLMSETAQADFLRSQGFENVNQDELRQDALRRIIQAEQLEERRRRKLAKIAHMSRYNDLMTQSDKDFITRIQVSQLVTQDPWAEDFYAQTYAQVMRNNMGLQGEERILSFGGAGGVGLPLQQRPSGRRASAIHKMEQQVEKIVQAARLREKEKGSNALHSLQGALGKTAGRSYKAAPRQLLQVSEEGEEEHEERHKAIKEGARIGTEALGSNAENLIRKEPLTRREALAILEELYDVLHRLERLAKEQPPLEDQEAFIAWDQEFAEKCDELWLGLRVTVPLETSVPHPFISLLLPAKGKKLLPRIQRFLDRHRSLTVLMLLHACFGQLDVVTDAGLLDSLEDSEERREAERQTDAFLHSSMRIVVPLLGEAQLRLLQTLLSTMMERNNIIEIARSEPGISLLTVIMSRLENIKTAPPTEELPTQNDWIMWQHTFNQLLELLMPAAESFFPSRRIANLPAARAEELDYPVWSFLATLALYSDAEQRKLVIASVRDKVVETVTSAARGLGDEQVRAAKLQNVNLLLHAVDLDSSLIAINV